MAFEYELREARSSAVVKELEALVHRPIPYFLDIRFYFFSVQLNPSSDHFAPTEVSGDCLILTCGWSYFSHRTMGIKSKSKAVSKSGAIVPATSAGVGGGKKNARYFTCCATVKVSEGKGHQCVGCSEIYCWRCKSKEFFVCPNDDSCVRILRRCRRCCNCETMMKALD